MIIVGIDLNTIKKFSLEGVEHYRYDFGTNIKVTTLTKSDNNKLLSSTLSFDCRQDKLMTEYYPNCRVYFDKDLIEDTDTFDGILVSSLIDTNTGSVYVGKYEKYPQKYGTLLISGNIESLAFESNKIVAPADIDIFTEASVLAVGSYNGVLYGATLLKDSSHLSFKLGNNKSEQDSSHTEYAIEHWFSSARVTEVE